MALRGLMLGGLCLTMAIGCASVGPRRPERRRDRLPPVPAPPTVRAPAPAAPPAALGSPAPIAHPATAVQNPPAAEITRVSVPPVAGNAPLPLAAATDAELDFVKARALHQRAADAYAGIKDYTVRLRRREAVGKTNPEEIILASFRKTPFSVYFKWIGTEGHGRELVYVHGQHAGKVHTLLAPTDPRFLGKVASLAPDSALLRARSRHPITQAGMGGLLESFAKVLGAGVPVKYLGTVQRPEYETPLEGVEHPITQALDAQLPGGRRWWFFDPATGLPALVIAHNAAGQEVEWYCFDRLLLNVGLDNDDFDPAKLWQGKR